MMVFPDEDSELFDAAAFVRAWNGMVAAEASVIRVTGVVGRRCASSTIFVLRPCMGALPVDQAAGHRLSLAFVWCLRLITVFAAA